MIESERKAKVMGIEASSQLTKVTAEYAALR